MMQENFNEFLSSQTGYVRRNSWVGQKKRKKKGKISTDSRLHISIDLLSFSSFYRGNIISDDLMTHRFIMCVSPTITYLASYPVERELFVLMQNSWLIRKQCFVITSITLWIIYVYFRLLLYYINVFGKLQLNWQRDKNWRNRM